MGIIKRHATEEYVDAKVADLVNSAPETLDTLGELATAFKENKDMVETLDKAITTKANKTELVELDTTLSNSGYAADSKSVGDALTQLDNKITQSLKPPPSVTSYSRPTSIPVISGMQIVFYAACAGTMTFTMGSKTYSHTLASPNDVGWMLWVQSGEIDGSFIFPSGERRYLEVGSVVSEASVRFDFESYSNNNPNYIVITIE